MADAEQAGKSRHPAEAFILGSGFSRAAHRSMPTLADLGVSLRETLLASPKYSAMLGDRVRRLLRGGHVPAGNVEMWLSSLADRQPFMSQPDASLNQALFQEISRQLIDLVAQPQEGFWLSSPSWLHRLVRIWHRRRTSVVTFNYDTIVEQSMIELDAPGADGDIVAAILTQLPRRAVTTAWGEVPSPTFRLLKLHGSLDWYWNPDDTSGDSLCRLTPGVAEADARAALAGKIPFIVPPMATKGPFYSLGLVRQLWQDAADALRVADRIVVIGYSVPLTDLATTAMLSQEANPEAEWHIVDPQAAAVHERLAQLGIPPNRIQNHPSVAAWVDTYEAHHCGRMSAELPAQILTYRNNHSQFAPIMSRRSRSDYSVVHAFEIQPDRVVLKAHTLRPQEILPAELPHEPDIVDALRQLEPARQVVVRMEGIEGDHQVLGALDPMPLRGSAAVPMWCPIEVQDLP